MYQMCQIRLLNILPNKKKNVKKICQRFVKFCQSGEISPNMVPLIGGGLICHPCELRTNDRRQKLKNVSNFLSSPHFFFLLLGHAILLFQRTRPQKWQKLKKNFFSTISIFSLTLLSLSLSLSLFATYLYYHFISISLFYFSSYLSSISLTISLLSLSRYNFAFNINISFLCQSF